MIRNLDSKSKKQHNYKRDMVLIIVALVLVVAFFQCKNRFFFDATQMNKRTIRSHEKIVYKGPATPTGLGLTEKDLAPVDRFAKTSGRHFEQIQIFIERQDSYGKVTDSTQLRFYTITHFFDGAEIKSVYTPTTRSRLAARIVRRLRGDMEKYFSVKKKMQGKDIKGFTNTM